MYRGPQRTLSGGGNEVFGEPLTPPAGNPRRRNGEEDGVSPNEYSPGLLDLHSFDTELLPEVCFLSMPLLQAASFSLHSSDIYFFRENVYDLRRLDLWV